MQFYKGLGYFFSTLKVNINSEIENYGSEG